MTMAGQSIEKNLENVRTRMRETCAGRGRKAASVKLLAVSKLHGPQAVRAAHAAQQMDFAENYLQEAEEKKDDLSDLPLRWHFIGRLQSNKLKAMAGNFVAIHSVDSVAHAEKLNQFCKEKNLVQDVFLQFNVANEQSKGGADSAAIEQLLTAAMKCANLRVMGLMVMPPLTENPEDARPHFARARKLLESWREKSAGRHPLNELSMGTSHDFKVAIEEGATWIRIGTEIFGPREENA